MYEYCIHYVQRKLADKELSESDPPIPNIGGDIGSDVATEVKRIKITTSAKKIYYVQCAANTYILYCYVV